MRFATKFDAWIVVCLAVAAFGSLGLPWILPSTHGPYSHPAPRALLWVPWLIWAVVLSCTLPQYYEVRGDGLFIRQGWRRILIPYTDLVEIQSSIDGRSAGVFSTDRLTIATRPGRTYLIAPADQSGFLAAVQQRCPALERKGFGLGLPFTSTAG